jgi:hypothetical protein
LAICRGNGLLPGSGLDLPVNGRFARETDMFFPESGLGLPEEKGLLQGSSLGLSERMDSCQEMNFCCTINDLCCQKKMDLDLFDVELFDGA